MYKFLLAVPLLSLVPLLFGAQRKASGVAGSKLANASPASCAGGLSYGNNETVTLYSGTTPKRYRLSIWWLSINANSWGLARDTSGVRNSGVKAGLGGNAPTLPLPYAPASMDLESHIISVNFPTPPTNNPVLAVCFESLP
jgi:hypothetical protein